MTCNEQHGRWVADMSNDVVCRETIFSRRREHLAFWWALPDATSLAAEQS